MDIPIQIFILGIGISLTLALLGFLRNPQIPAMLCFGGMFLLLFAVATDNIILSHGVITNTEGEIVIYHYDIDTSNQDISLSDEDFIIAEYASNSSSLLVGDIVNCVDLSLSRLVNSNLTGNSIIGVFDSLGASTNTWATVPVTDFDDDPSNPLFYTYCFADYTIQTGDRIGIRYDLATKDDNLLVLVLDPSPFDDDITRVQTFTTVWVEEGAESDLTMRLYFVDDGETTEHILYQFTELPKVLFALFGAIMMLGGAIMVGRNQ